VLCTLHNIKWLGLWNKTYKNQTLWHTENQVYMPFLPSFSHTSSLHSAWGQGQLWLFTLLLFCYDSIRLLRHCDEWRSLCWSLSFRTALYHLWKTDSILLDVAPPPQHCQAAHLSNCATSAQVLPHAWSWIMQFLLVPKAERSPLLFTWWTSYCHDNNLEHIIWKYLIGI